MDIDRYNKWVKKRRVTTVAFFLQSFMLGIEDSATLLTLWLYITVRLNVSQPEAWYGLVSTAYFLCSIGTMTVICRLVDKSRRIQNTFLICNSLAVIGNLLYSVPINPFYLIFGRAVASFGAALRPIMASEIVRSYPLQKQSSLLSALSGFFAFGYTVGPFISLPLQSVHFESFFWNIFFENSPGLIAAALFGIMAVICLFFVYDLSRELDLKAANYVILDDLSDELSENTTLIENQHVDGGDVADQSIFRILKLMMRKSECAYLLAANFCGYYLMVSVDMWLPLLVFETFQYGFSELVFTFLTQCIMTAITLTIITLIKPNDFSLYIGVVFTHICMIIVWILLYIMVALHDLSYFVRIFVLLLFNFLFSFFASSLFFYFTNITAKMVTSSIQGFAESIRLAVSMLASVFAYISSPFFFSYLDKLCFGFILANCLSLFIFVRKRQFFCKPYILIK